jgi:excisionase family DNA binding protein
VTGRDRLLRSLAPEVVEAIEQLVSDCVQAALDEAHAANGGSSPWLTLEDAADYLRVSTKTIERRIKAKRVRSTTIGRRRLLHRDDLDRLARAATREETAPTAPPRRRARTLEPDRDEA